MFSYYHFITGWVGFTFLVIFAWLNIFFRFSKYRSLREYNGLLCVAALLFGLFATITPDYYSYFGLIEKVKEWIFPGDVEYVYAFILPLIHYNFYIFRFIIVVPSFILVMYVLKKYSADLNIGISLFIIFYLLTFSTVIRSSLADSIFYIGALYYFSHASIRGLLCTLFCFTLSLLLHKSSFMLAIPVILALTTGKQIMKYSLILFPVLFIVSSLIINLVFKYYVNEATGNEYQAYQAYQSGSVQLANYINNTICFILISYTLFKAKRINKDKNGFYPRLYRLVFWGGYIWLILSMSNVSRYIGSRFLSHMFIPIILLMTYSCISKDRRYIEMVLILGLMMICSSEFSTLTKLRELI